MKWLITLAIILSIPIQLSAQEYDTDFDMSEIDEADKQQFKRHLSIPKFSWDDFFENVLQKLQGARNLQEATELNFANDPASQIIKNTVLRKKELLDLKNTLKEKVKELEAALEEYRKKFFPNRTELEETTKKALVYLVLCLMTSYLSAIP